MYGQQHQQSPYYLMNSSSSAGQPSFPSPLFFESSFTDSPQNLHQSSRLTPSPQQERHPTSSHEDQSQVQARSLPARDVTATTIQDAFVSFILYCNPQISLDTDVSTLGTSFQTPPRSDDKAFETYSLFQLIKKLDAKELKTWGQLALDLGVEPPDASKGQSVQKVQQYTVRLKRWMRAMHIDAFFEYLLGKQHTYFLDIPPTSDPYPASGRDGVQVEEDLAIRALDPTFRPKRGRRRNSDIDQEADVESSRAAPFSAFPQSAHPDRSGDPWAVASAVTPQSLAPWATSTGVPQSAVATAAPRQLRWQLHGPALQTPATPHPMSAHPTTMAGHIDAAFDNEPMSAITPSTRKRRKHGPAVSSAWPSTLTPGGKPRGRPPASRTVQDGPYGTFPSRISVERSPKAAAKEHVPKEDQLSDIATTQPVRMPPPPPVMRNNSGGSGGKAGRLSLSLQVPDNPGGPVIRLPTPPTVLVNGETSGTALAGMPTITRSASDGLVPQLSSFGHLAASSRGSQGLDRQMDTHDTLEGEHHAMQAHPSEPASDRETPRFPFEMLKRVLTSDLLRAELVGRQKRLTGDEAKRLADAVLLRLNVIRTDAEQSRSDIARLTAASWLGLGSQFNVPIGPAVSSGKRITTTYFKTAADGYEEPVSARDTEGAHGLREVFGVSWKVTLGTCSGNFDLKDIELASQQPPTYDDSHDTMLLRVIEASQSLDQDTSWAAQAVKDFDATQRVTSQTSDGDDGVDWKRRYMALEFGAKIVRGEMDRLRSRMLERVLDVLL